jgi:hypothetical protein
MAEVERINVEDARRKTKSGEALLVCAYNDEAKCEAMKLEGSISLADLKARLASGSRDQEIIFYCG